MQIATVNFFLKVWRAKQCKLKKILHFTIFCMLQIFIYLDYKMWKMLYKKKLFLNLNIAYLSYFTFRIYRIYTCLSQHRMLLLYSDIPNTYRNLLVCSNWFVAICTALVSCVWGEGGGEVKNSTLQSHHSSGVYVHWVQITPSSPIARQRKKI